MTLVLRPAAEADLEELFAILCEDEAGEQLVPPHLHVPAFLRHELASGRVRVAERHGGIVGFASVITRGPVAFMSEFFVRKAMQSAGVGRALLQDALPGTGIRCTLSSSDPRALGLYIRAGLLPRWQHFLLRAEVQRLAPRVMDEYVSISVAQAGEPELREWDSAASGRDRPQDHAYWTRENQAVPLWFRRDGQVIGYGYVQMRSNDSLWYPEALTIGPVGASNPDDALACALAAVDWARGRGAMLRLSVPAAHPALVPLLDLGFRIGYVETFMASSPEPIFDPSCYVPSGNDLL